MTTKFLPSEYWLTDLSKLFEGYNTSTSGSFTVSKPKNFIEFEEQYEFHLAVPGLTKEDIKVRLDGDLLDISYSINKEENKVYFVYSNFSKTFTLPEDVNKQGIEAEVKNGVLTVILPKQVKKTIEPKQIEVK